MSLCTEWSLVKLTEGSNRCRPLYCRSWGCDTCRPKRKSQLLALAASGEPQRFLTLTVNPATGTDPESRLKSLSHAWKVLVKRLRRLYGDKAIEYLAVVEETKRGEPHLHILLRSPFIPWSLISAAMDELINAPIVDIRKIRNQRQVVSYVAKYITKAPAQFGKSKRYWHSKAYELDKLARELFEVDPSERWKIDRRSIGEILREWWQPGWRTTLADNGHGLSVYIGGEYWQIHPPGTGSGRAL